MAVIQETGLPIYSFAPIADLKSKSLILGTIPGKESLRLNAYYAHPQNVFWKIIFSLMNPALFSRRSDQTEDSASEWHCALGCFKNVHKRIKP